MILLEWLGRLIGESDIAGQMIDLGFQGSPIGVYSQPLQGPTVAVAGAASAGLPCPPKSCGRSEMLI